jgi:chromosome segregation ATPase
MKKGALFPALVNIIAVVLLAAGLFLLYYFHGQDEIDIREQNTSLGITERKLIQEIRKETARQIYEKEQEIDDIMGKLTGVDAEYQNLQQEMEKGTYQLTQQNIENMNRLKSLQEEYRSNLSVLNTERAKIVEESRAREANLHAQLEEKVGALTAQVAEANSDLSAAREELSKLSDEQEKARKAEAQLAGLYAAVNNQIKAGELDDASRTLSSMRDFLNTPSFQTIRSIEARKALHLGAVTSLEAMIAGTRRAMQDAAAANAAALAAQNQSGSAADAETIAALKAQNLALEQISADQEKTIAAFSSQGDGLSLRMAEYETTLSNLRTQVSGQQQTLDERDNTITALRTQTAAQNGQITERDGTISRQQQTITEQAASIESLNTQLTSIRQALQALTQ